VIGWMRLALLPLLAACSSGGDTPPAPAAVPPAPAPSTPTPTPVVWTVDNIQDLVPKAPPHDDAVPKAIPPLPAYDTTLQLLGSIVDRYDGDPDNPWAIAHGILARGTSLKLPDGRDAVAHVFAAYAEPRQAGTHTLIGFPKELGKIRVEPHTDLLLKNMSEAGVDPGAVFVTRQGNVPVADLYRWTLLKSFLVAQTNHSSYADPNDMPWSLQALAAWAPGNELQWRAADGTPMDLDYLADFVTAVVTQESAFMFEDMQKGQTFRREGQRLFSYTCGGAHLVQGASYAVARGFGSAKSRKAIEAQVPLLFYRMPIELAQYDEVMKGAPKQKVRLLVQRMKFLGHWLESISKLAIEGFYVPDEKQLVAIEGAAQNLTLTVDALQKAGVFDNLPDVRREDEQLYLDVIGDSAHAVRGLELAIGRGHLKW
jgi:hypothetical protein